jgi:hypothetical protein
MSKNKAAKTVKQVVDGQNETNEPVEQTEAKWAEVIQFPEDSVVHYLQEIGVQLNDEQRKQIDNKLRFKASINRTNLKKYIKDSVIHPDKLTGQAALVYDALDTDVPATVRELGERIVGQLGTTVQTPERIAGFYCNQFKKKGYIQEV